MKAFFVAFALFLCALPAYSLVIEKLPLEGIVWESDLVCHGIVSSVQTRFDPSLGPRRIVSDIHMEVFETIPKGTDTVVFTVLGGEVGEEGQKIPGMPQFVVGDEVVVFLNPMDKNSKNIFPVAWGQGIFFVQPRISADPPLVKNWDNGVVYRSKNAHSTFSSSPLPMDLQELLSIARILLAEENPIN